VVKGKEDGDVGSLASPGPQPSSPGPRLLLSFYCHVTPAILRRCCEPYTFALTSQRMPLFVFMSTHFL
jgi:hypothetical protein